MALGAIARASPAIAGGIRSAAPEVSAGASFLKDAAPKLEDEAVVEVVGQPGARKQQLYYLALSAAFGLARRFDLGIAGKFVPPPVGLIMVEYDAADNWVRATIRFKTSLLAVAATKVSVGGDIGKTIGLGVALPFSLFGGPIFGQDILDEGQRIGESFGRQVQDYILSTEQSQRSTSNPFYAEAPVYSGPKDELIGGPFNFVGFGPTGVLIPSTSKSPGAPTLIFNGFPILTTSPTIKLGERVIPSPNPVPPGDNRSRGVYPTYKPVVSGRRRPDGIDSSGDDGLNRFLIPMVFTALTDPGGNGMETFPPPGPDIGEI